MGGRKGSTSSGSSYLLQAQPVQRSASFNASSTVPLKITILDDTRRETSASYCVKNSKSLSNCSLISKIVNKSDGSRSIISHIVPSSASPLPIDGGGSAVDPDKRKEVHYIPITVPTTASFDGVEKFRDYYV